MLYLGHHGGVGANNDDIKSVGSGHECSTALELISRIQFGLLVSLGVGHCWLCCVV